jgi:hypothetical protein
VSDAPAQPKALVKSKAATTAASQTKKSSAKGGVTSETPRPKRATRKSGIKRDGGGEGKNR